LIRLKERNKVLVFVSHANEAWADGDIFGMSENLLDLHWDDHGDKLDTWETKGLDRIGVAKCDVFFYGDEECPDPVIEGPKWLWVPS